MLQPLIADDWLDLVPIPPEYLQIYTRPDSSFEKQFGYQSSRRVMMPDALDALESDIYRLIDLYPNDWLFYTFWLVVDRSLNQIVAEVGFKGPPNDENTVEIGYGVYPKFRRMGIATASVELTLKWAFTNQNINRVIALTEQSNFASEGVLRKNGFEQMGSFGNLNGWEIRKPIFFSRQIVV